MRRVIRNSAQLVLLVFFSATTFAGESLTARQWLERMSAAMSQMSYQGTFVYMRGLNVESMRITHVVDDDGVRERLYSFDGPQREVIRDKNGIRCVLADSKAVMEDPFVAGVIFPEIPLEALSEDNHSYQFIAGDSTRIAGHKAILVRIKPTDRYRYGYELWLEENTGLLLKWAVYDDASSPLARLMFTQLNLGDDIDRSELVSSVPQGEFVLLGSGMPEKKSLKYSEPRWRPSELPPGFSLAAHSIQEEAGIAVFEHQVYSDGIASVSVYIEDLPKDEAGLEGHRAIGTANAFSRSIGSKQVTVIGEVPDLTVRSIGNAVIPPGPPD